MIVIMNFIFRLLDIWIELENCDWLILNWICDVCVWTENGWHLRMCLRNKNENWIKIMCETPKMGGEGEGWDERCCGSRGMKGGKVVPVESSHANSRHKWLWDHSVGNDGYVPTGHMAGSHIGAVEWSSVWSIYRKLSGADRLCPRVLGCLVSILCVIMNVLIIFYWLMMLLWMIECMQLVSSRSTLNRIEAHARETCIELIHWVTHLFTPSFPFQCAWL